MRRALLLTLAALAALAAPVAAAEPVRIGDLNSYGIVPGYTEPYRNGWRLAVDEINAAGGVLGGRPLAVISKDDGGKPAEAAAVARRLIDEDKVHLLAGTFLSHTALAVSEVARTRKVPFVAGGPLSDALVWEKGHRYAFRIRANTWMLASMLAEEAAKLPARRWAVVAPDYEFGRAAAVAFSRLLKERRPDVEIVAEQFPPYGRIDAPAVAQALAAARPEAIFNATFGRDLAALLEAGREAGLFDGRAVASLLTGEPEYLGPLGDAAPAGWLVTGYPGDAIDLPAHRKFAADYRARFAEEPGMGSLIGYATVKAIAAALDKAGSTEPDRVVAALEGLRFDTPVGTATMRAADHQSTLGAWVGRLAVQDGVAALVDWRHADGAAHLPVPEQVAPLRPH